MSNAAGVVDIYDVSPAPDNRVRLSMILRAACFPDFAVDLDVEVALRVGMALVSNAEYVRTKSAPGKQAAGGAHGG